MHEIISQRAVLPGSTTARLFSTSVMKDSLRSQSGCDKLSGRSTSRLRKEILGTGDKEVATGYTMLESLLEFIRDKCGANVTELVQVEGMLARSGPVCLLVRDPVLFAFRPCPHREYSLKIFVKLSPSTPLNLNLALNQMICGSETTAVTEHICSKMRQLFHELRSVLNSEPTTRFTDGPKRSDAALTAACPFARIHLVYCNHGDFQFVPFVINK